MDEQERILTEDEAQPEAEAPVEARTEDEGARARLVAMLLGAEARCAAALMGVKEARLDHVARLAGLEGIDPEDETMRQKVAQAVRAVLARCPNSSPARVPAPRLPLGGSAAMPLPGDSWANDPEPNNR
jgi:hypothetical protein